MSKGNMKGYSNANLEIELRGIEVTYADIKRDIAWKKKYFWDMGFCHYVESEVNKINDAIDDCHKFIVQVHTSPSELDGEFIRSQLNDLKQLLYRVGVITDTNCENLSYAEL